MRSGAILLCIRALSCICQYPNTLRAYFFCAECAAEVYLLKCDLYISAIVRKSAKIVRYLSG